MMHTLVQLNLSTMALLETNKFAFVESLAAHEWEVQLTKISIRPEDNKGRNSIRVERATKELITTFLMF